MAAVSVQLKENIVGSSSIRLSGYEYVRVHGMGARVYDVISSERLSVPTQPELTPFHQINHLITKHFLLAQH